VANIVFVRSLGRVVEFAERVEANSPAGAELVFRLVAATGVESDNALRVKDSFSDLVSGATDFATNTGGSTFKVFAAADVVVTYDDTNFKTAVDVPDQTWTAVANDGTGGIGDLVSGYDPVGSQTLTDILPMTLHDFAVTPDGSDITAQIAAGPPAGFFTAQSAA
jgi:hypothetical protein